MPDRSDGMLKGVDISKWQSVGTGDQGADFVICKATEGAGYVDPVCDQHYQRAKSQDKLLGVYHFARPDLNNPEAEAEWFVKNIQGYIGKAILVLDWEWLNPNNKGPWLNPSWAKRWLEKVCELTGVRPLIYMSATVITDYGLDWSAVAKDYGLWIAGYPKKYDVPDPATPNPGDMPYGIGPWAFWAIWQYTSSAGTLDRDIANMTKTAWKKYAKPDSKPTPEPEPAPAPAPAPEDPLDKYTDEQLADMVIAGEFGNGDERKQKLGKRYDAVQAIVDSRYAKKTPDQIADEVIAGKWGNGAEREQKLEAAGYNYQEVQDIVNKKLGQNTYINYAVRRGDTLSSIAAQYGTTWQKIAKDNNLSNPDLILPGQRLIIKK